MPPIEVHRKTGKSIHHDAGDTGISCKETDTVSYSKKLSGILKIKDPRIIEEIAESDLLA
jgi:hypothetical protein